MISFIVPIYNTEKYIDRCIQSLLRSGAKEYEIILIDDGSVDQSGLICEYYKKAYPNTIIVITKNNEGVSAARNDGINLARGKYIIFVDSDDFILEETLSDIELDERVDFYVFSYTTKLEHNEQKKVCIRKEKVDIVEMSEKILYKRYDETNIYNYSTPWAKVYRKDIINKNQLRFNENLSVGEDMIFNLQYIKYCNSYLLIDKVIYYYEKRGGSSTNRFNDKKIANDIIFNNTLKEILSDSDIIKVRPELYYDNIVLSTSQEFITVYKYYQGNSNGLPYIKQLQLSVVDKNVLMKCSKHVRIRDKLIYFILLNRGGILLYDLLACRKLIRK